ncbi:hypothetical protein LCGC14_2898360, partial [marine sediment metagenome]
MRPRLQQIKKRELTGEMMRPRLQQIKKRELTGDCS